MDRLYVDFHIIQSVPPSCVNRDDTGSPKTAIYGGVQRARVSSQAWKKAVRDYFPEALKGFRTKKIVELVAEQILAINASADAEVLAKKLLTSAKLKDKSLDAGPSAPLFFMSPGQARALAHLALENPEADKAAAQAALNSAPSVDIALFGRMVADDPTLNADASCQVAHAISTHKVNNEFDYFTAVDDRSPEDNAGAAMIGTVEFNSSTLYRYATIAAHELKTLLADSNQGAGEAIAAFAEAFICSMPTGKQNTFANRTIPSAVYVALRQDQPINLVGAFEKAVKPSEHGYIGQSVKQLKEYAEGEVYSSFAAEPAKAFTVGTGLDGLGLPVSLMELIPALRAEVEGRLQ
ncbi:MAG: type I-E CRISPR-associated protein Cas7/Cse4/CasC [Christensenellaceae bacterium]|jgi:CRISPR system Cascade subunit CasC|nr:type I-E CRISPR-associated protein Cas7/Cse4/CasC [Christensenellaceae bacterium]